MSATTLLRCVGLAVVLAMALPAPASPQLGKWVKKAIKQKIADKIEQTVLGPDSTSASPSAAGVLAAAASGNGGGSLRAKKGSPAPAGPTFDENVLEITPELLDRLEKGLAAESRDRKAGVKEASKVLSNEDYQKCERAVYLTPEYQKAIREYAAAPKKDLPATQRASGVYSNRLEELLAAKCGPGGNGAVSAQYGVSQRSAQKGQAASGLTDYQYAILQERILPLCTAASPAAGPGGETRIPAGGFSSLYYVYAPGEVAALRPRCAKLMRALIAG